jgi:hypothetical protein
MFIQFLTSSIGGGGIGALTPQRFLRCHILER